MGRSSPSSSRGSRSRSRSRSRTRSSGSTSGSTSGSHVEEEVHTTYRPRTRTRYNTVYYDAPVYDSSVYSAPTPTSASVFPPSATDAAFHDGLWSGRAEALTVGALGLYLNHELNADRFTEADQDEDAAQIFEDELGATRNLMDELKAEHAKTDPLVSKIQMPRSGTYHGLSAEDDGGDQGVMTHLSFKEDGTIEGWGEDAEDGRYAIEDGVWSTPGGDGDAMPLQTGGRVAWVEKYDRGFQVALRGQVLADGTIRAMWASTFGVAGSVDLEMRR